MDDEEFESLVDEAIDSIPSEFREKLENVSIFVENLPNIYQINKLQGKGFRGLLLGLYEGVPHTKRGRYGVGATLPDKITIFRRPILAVARSPEHLKELVRKTVIHEIAHHFGMSEEMISDAKSKGDSSRNRK